MMKVQTHQLQYGLTLLEVIVVLAIVGILVGIAVPSFYDLMAKQRVKGAAETFSAALFNAKAEAVKTNQDIHVVILPPNGVADAGASPHSLSLWCYGMTSAGDSFCDCSGTDASKPCAPGSVVDGANSPNVTITYTNTERRTFEPLRGTANGSQGTVTFQSSDDTDKVLGVVLSTMGRVKVCRPSGDILGYGDC
jgi:type IV fimbrial biogenesis protein FimT